MIHYPTAIDIDELTREILETPVRQIPDRSGHAKGPGVKSGWIRGLSNARIDTPQDYPLLEKELVSFCERIDARREAISQILLNNLWAGGKLHAHRDGPPYRERWHLVLITDPRVIWFDAIYGSRHLARGWNGPIPYCGIVHSMVNASDIDRYHLVIDIDREMLGVR